MYFATISLNPCLHTEIHMVVCVLFGGLTLGTERGQRGCRYVHNLTLHCLQSKLRVIDFPSPTVASCKQTTSESTLHKITKASSEYSQFGVRLLWGSKQSLDACHGLHSFWYFLKLEAEYEKCNSNAELHYG